MVGDGTTNDIAGAQRAGIRTIWYNPTKRRFPEGAQPPDVVIRKLADLPAAVDRLAGVEPEKRSRKQRKADADAAAAAAAAAAAKAVRARRPPRTPRPPRPPPSPPGARRTRRRSAAPGALTGAPAGPPDGR